MQEVPSSNLGGPTKGNQLQAKVWTSCQRALNLRHSLESRARPRRPITTTSASCIYNFIDTALAVLWYTALRVEAVYENGMLKPLQPLNLSEHERVAITIYRAATPYEPDHDYVQALRNSLKDAGPAPGIEEVRRRLSKIPCSMAADFIAEREDR